MQERHANKQQYFQEQVHTTEKYVVPFVEQTVPVQPGWQVLEIGCGEGGNLIPFLDRDCEVIGVDLSESKIELAKQWLGEHPKGKNSKLLCQDIYDVDDFGVKFDLIMMRDVIEHIHDQERFMSYLKRFLAPEGRVFFGFPPWYNPFGGHQQICGSKFLSKLPYFHLLPMPLYLMVLRMFGESKKRIEDLKEIKETGISIERFNRIVKKENYQVDRHTPFFINPNYQIKFGLKPRKQNPIIAAIPFVRNFFTTAVYYTISLRKS